MEGRDGAGPQGRLRIPLLILAFGLAGLVYQLLSHHGRLKQSAALFVGLPVLLAMLLAMPSRFSPARSTRRDSRSEP